MTTGSLLMLAAGTVVGLWVLHRVGRALTQLLEALAVIAAVFVTVWLVAKGVYRLARLLIKWWRTSLTTAGALVWCWSFGWLSLLVTVALVVAGLGVWRCAGRLGFEARAGRRLRSWWQRWVVYAPRAAHWFRACGLAVPDREQTLTVPAGTHDHRLSLSNTCRSSAPPSAASIRRRAASSWPTITFA